MFVFEREFVMKYKISHQKYYELAWLGYVIIAASCNGFYQGFYLHEQGLPPWFWAFGIFIGSVLLVAKNILGSNDKIRSFCLDIAFMLPALIVPIVPVKNEITWFLMMVYFCVFIVIYCKKNRPEKEFVMKPKISYQKYHYLSILGYMIVGFSCIMFYQQLDFYEVSSPNLFWVFCAFIGSIILVTKNILGSTNKFRSILLDFAFMLPAAILPFFPIKADIMRLLVILYFYSFVAIYIWKNNRRGELDWVPKKPRKKPKYISLLLIPLVFLGIFYVVLKLRDIFDGHTSVDAVALDIISIVLMLSLVILTIKSYFKKD